jgi:hypothetical protein
LYGVRVCQQRYRTLVTERSGKKSWVHWRLQCPKFLRQTFAEWAAQTINRSFWAGAYYRQQRAKRQLAPHRCEGPRIQVGRLALERKCAVCRSPSPITEVGIVEYRLGTIPPA